MEYLLIKIGGSLIAPKDKDGLDINYLIKISNFLKKLNKKVFLIHGAGNIGHNFLLTLIKKTNLDLQTLLKLYKIQIQKHIFDWYRKIQKFFPVYKRIYIKDVFQLKEIPKSNIITGGDIDWQKFSIISGDDAFSYMASFQDFGKKVILTNVDGVLDNKGNVIRNIDKNNFSKIKFWQVKNDLTGGMKKKVEKLLGKGPIYILNGYNFKNLKLFFSDPEKAIFTKIV